MSYSIPHNLYPQDHADCVERETADLRCQIRAWVAQVDGDEPGADANTSAGEEQDEDDIVTLSIPSLMPASLA